MLSILTMLYLSNNETLLTIVYLRNNEISLIDLYITINLYRQNSMIVT